MNADSSKKRNVRQQLIKTATTLFAEKGPDATSVDEIVRKARCNKRMVYHYFGDKEGLRRAILAKVYERIANFEAECLESPAKTSPESFIRSFISNQLRFLHQNPEIVTLLMWENLGGGRIAKQVKAGPTKNPILTALKKILPAARKSGGREAEQFFMTMVGASYFTFSNRVTLAEILGFNPATRQSLKQREDHLVNFFVQSLTRRHSQSS
jgi:TetR/AcrR family transcriptional regulator